MNILIAGASGSIGQALIHGLSREHSFTLLGRHKDLVRQVHSGQFVSVSWEMLDSLNASKFDAVINLCGSNISSMRWTQQVKEEIINSRVNTTETLINWILEQKAKPHFYCANAVGIYGMQETGDPTAYDEDSKLDNEHPKDFLSEVGIKWQQALKSAQDAGLAVTSTRFGVVLKKGEGFLGKLYPSFISGFGSIIGSGQQYLSWVDSQDVVNAYRFLLKHMDMTGPVNITSPNPCTQKEFAKAYANSLHRPLFLIIPAFMIDWIFGEMGDSLICHGQKVLPKRLLEAGFEFQWPNILEALEHR